MPDSVQTNSLQGGQTSSNLISALTPFAEALGVGEQLFIPPKNVSDKPPVSPDYKDLLKNNILEFINAKNYFGETRLTFLSQLQIYLKLCNSEEAEKLVSDILNNTTLNTTSKAPNLFTKDLATKLWSSENSEVVVAFLQYLSKNPEFLKQLLDTLPKVEDKQEIKKQPLTDEEKAQYELRTIIENDSLLQLKIVELQLLDKNFTIWGELLSSPEITCFLDTLKNDPSFIDHVNEYFNRRDEFLKISTLSGNTVEPFADTIREFTWLISAILTHSEETQFLFIHALTEYQNRKADQIWENLKERPSRPSILLL